MSFENDVKKWAEKANLKMEDVIKSAIFEIGQSVIMRTPVDKGRAINSWMFSIDIPSTSTRGEGLSGAASFANLQGVKESAPGHIMYCTNNVPYVRYLEYGTANMRAFSMIRVPVKQFKRIVNQRARS